MWAIIVQYLTVNGEQLTRPRVLVRRLHNKTRRGWCCETRAIGKLPNTTVYIVDNYTPEMNEWSNDELVSYAQNNFITILNYGGENR